MAEINGKLHFSADYDERGSITNVHAEWEGGPIIGVTPEFLEDADPKWITVGESLLTIGHFNVRIIETVHDSTGKISHYICERVEG